MEIKEAVLWALLGGGAAELTLALGAMRPSATKKIWAWPWTRAEVPAYCAGMLFRLVISGVVAAPCAATHKVSDGMTAFAVGVAAPLLLARIAATAHALIGPDPRLAHGPPGEGTPADLPTSHTRTDPFPEPRVSEGTSAVHVEETGDENATQ
jgi:hypothetical protein